MVDTVSMYSTLIGHRRAIFKTHDPLRRLSRKSHSHQQDSHKHATPKAIKKRIKEQEKVKGKEKEKVKDVKTEFAIRDYSLVEVLPEIKEHLEEHLYSDHGPDGIEKAELGAYSGDKLVEDVDVHHSSAAIKAKRHHRHHHSHHHHHKKKSEKAKDKPTQADGRKPHKHHHKHAHHRPRTVAEREKYLESLEARLRSGSYTVRETMQEKAPTEVDEAELLELRDLEDINCE